MQFDDLWLALACVLVIEGLLPFVSPAVWRQTFSKILSLEDGQIRLMGLLSMGLGLAVIWLLA